MNRKMKDKGLKIIIQPKYINGKPTIVLLEGTYCSNCGTFLAPPEATDDQRIQAAIDHTCTTTNKYSGRNT